MRDAREDEAREADATYTLVLDAEELASLDEVLRDSADARVSSWLQKLATLEPDEEGDGCCEHCPIHGGF